MLASLQPNKWMHLFWTNQYDKNKNTAVAHWLKYCATDRKAAGSNPYGVIGIFHWHNPSDHTRVLGVDSASNRNEYQEFFLGVKAVGA